ncbi:hypothetical protein [Breznakiella homolactica]|uniref:Uncharacterized protein n=1 Tax=Breznakiella homolactica TaxID=2798577 RepID=A0A7T7XK08_9SPIR|nr:hypothetical protein [Breznakiella homolactica]QQO07720.1 hypothetical protein JFL75_12275 [Breznakiella homolactica]
MDSALEQRIVKLYVNKAYRTRILHELETPQKRSRVLHRLCHNYTDILKSQVMNPLVVSDAKERTAVILRHGGQKENCYVLSLLKNYDGIFLPLTAAMNAVAGNGMAALIYCGNGIAYFEAEQVQGPPPRFLLMGE